MKKIRIGLAGLGVVGKSVYQILLRDKDLINKRSAQKLELVAVAARTKRDYIDETQIKFYENALDMADDANIDVIVEVIGGEGVAHELALKTLKNGKKLVTANKALLAVQGYELSKVAEEHGGYIAFEAAVGASIPIIKIFREGLAANEIKEFHAILNGTCNYILTKMEHENLDFATALKQAQELGYAESDPASDVDGIDTAHKLSLLAAIASGSTPQFGKIFVEGIRNITIDDIKLAAEFGYKIKLLAVHKQAKIGEDHSYQAVYPALVLAKEKIAQIDDSFNAILAQSSNADFNLSVGRGAGGRETASAVIADLIDIANDRYAFEFGIANSGLNKISVAPITERFGRYFIKLVLDKNLVQERKLNQEFLQEVKVEKSYFYDDATSGLVCGLITDFIVEKNLQNLLTTLDNSLVKEAKFLRVEETGF